MLIITLFTDILIKHSNISKQGSILHCSNNCNHLPPQWNHKELDFSKNTFSNPRWHWESPLSVKFPCRIFLPRRRKMNPSFTLSQHALWACLVCSSAWSNFYNPRQICAVDWSNDGVKCLPEWKNSFRSKIKPAWEGMIAVEIH